MESLVSPIKECSLRVFFLLSSLSLSLSLLIPAFAVDVGENPAITRVTLNGVEFQFARIPAGRYILGSIPFEAERQNDFERETYEVEVKAFSVGVTHITQKQYQSIMGVNPSHFKGDLNRPVENITYAQAQEFVKRFNQLFKEQTGIDGKFDLPTSDEAEIFARGKQPGAPYTIYPWGNDASKETLNRFTWYGDNCSVKGIRQTHPVGLKEKNGHGLYDTSGNVWIWTKSMPYCGDVNRRIVRGGSFGIGDSFLRPAICGVLNLNDKDEETGIRILERL